MVVSEADNYFLNISKMGYAEVSRQMRLPSRGGTYVLTQAYAVPIDPAVENVVIDGRGNPCPPQVGCNDNRGRVTIPANALSLSPPPVGGLTAYIATYNPSTDALPGDQTAVNAAGQRVALISYGALFIEVRDSAGTKYNIAPSRTARIEIPIQDALPPPAIDMWKYNPSTGLWNQRAGTGALVNSRYVFNVPSFSTQNADIQKTDPACLYIDISDELRKAHPLMNTRLQVRTSPGGSVRVFEKQLDEERNVFYNLPTNAPFTLDILEPQGAANRLIQTLTGTTGGPWGGVGFPGRAEPNCRITTVAAADFDATASAFTRFLSRRGVGDPAQATGYYNKIDPQNLRATLGEFWTANGFDASGTAPDDAATAFINFNELGFGRDMHCHKDSISQNVACYVTNYGKSDQAPGNFVLAQLADKSEAGSTLAMEYSPGPAGTKIVKFYAFGGGEPGSLRVLSVDLDGAGEKFVPSLCLNCHGGLYAPVNPNGPTDGEVDMGSSFRELDIYGYRDGTAGDRANSLASGLQGILEHEKEFMKLNLKVRDTAPKPAISDLIKIWYHGNDTIPFVQNAVPSGWQTDASTQNLYLKVVAKSCRTCHIALEGDLPEAKVWATYEQFKTYRLNGFLSFAVCYGDPSMGVVEFADAKRNRYMPHAHKAFKNFWLDRDAYSTLGNYTGPGWATSINSEPTAECVP
jgi:hypothetical protein